jgi:hypothetical protein
MGCRLTAWWMLLYIRNSLHRFTKCGVVYLVAGKSVCVVGVISAGLAIHTWHHILLALTLVNTNIFDLESCNYWDITPHNPFKLNRRFGGTCRLNLQGQIISQGRSMKQRARKTNVVSYGFVFHKI